MSRKYLWAIVAFMLITAPACDSSNGDAHADLADASADAETGADAAADAAADAQDGGDIGDEWPEQDQRGEAPTELDWQMPEAGPDALAVLVANVGNIDFRRCNDVAFNLCWADQEVVISERIAELDPDLVLLQEVLAAGQCDQVSEPDDDHVCHPDFADGQPQARRLLGDDYTIVCDERVGYECIGLHTRAGTIEGCASGQLCPAGAQTAPAVDGCDDGFTISAATIVVDGQRVDVVNAHPPSDADGPEQGRRCRAAYLEYVFAQDAALVSAEPILFGGDLNFDPFRLAPTNDDVALWGEHVGLFGPTHSGDEPAFAYHSGVVEHDPPYWSAPVVELTLDHLISRGFIGRCITLGAQAGHAPLDRGLGEPIERLDHLALWCAVELGE